MRGRGDKLAAWRTTPAGIRTKSMLFESQYSHIQLKIKSIPRAANGNTFYSLRQVCSATRYGISRVLSFHEEHPRIRRDERFNLTK
jgi:hypothetical protein